MTLKICIAQLNFVVGDLAGNAQKIIDASRTAYAEGARLVLTPELSICGYAAEDLFLRPAFIAACHDAVKRVADELAALKDLTVVVGHPTGGDRRTRSVAVQDRLNAASVLRLLLENTNLVVTRETILQVVWGTDISVESRTVDMHIRTLRKKLGDAGRYICTVRKVGYKLADNEEGEEE